MSALFASKLSPGCHDLRTTASINSITYRQISPEKSPLNETRSSGKSDVVNKPQRHIIHKVIRRKEMLEDGKLKSLGDIARKEGLTRARITQIINLPKLPSQWKEFVLGLDGSKEIRKYTKRRLRNYYSDKYAYAPPSIKKELCQEPPDEFPKKNRGKKKQPLKIRVVEIEELLPLINLSAQKKIIQKAVLRKLKELEEKENKKE